MENKNLFFTVLLALVVLFIFGLFQGNISGGVSSDNNAFRGVHTCFDSDADNDDVSGYVEVRIGKNIRQYYDRCSGGGLQIVENICTVNKDGDPSRGFYEKWCELGEICDDGECISDTDRY